MKKLIAIFLCLFVVSGCSQSDDSTSSSEKTSSSISTQSSVLVSDTLVTSSSESSAVISTTDTTVETTAYVETPQPTLDEFVGGWGVPQSGNLFFINSDGTISGSNIQSGEVTYQMESMTLYYTEDGRSALSYVMNGIQRELIKEFDGSATADGQNYTYLGNVSLSQYSAEQQQADENQETQYVDANGTGLIKGSNNGIYHVPGSQYYERTTNPAAWFKTISEAEAAGYRAPR